MFRKTGIGARSADLVRFFALCSNLLFAHYIYAVYALDFQGDAAELFPKMLQLLIGGDAGDKQDI